MKLELNKIFEGFRNAIVPPEKLKELINTVSEERLNICRDCKWNSTKGKVNLVSQCRACGCFLIPKTKCLSCDCGLASQDLPPLWTAVASDEVDEEIKKILKRSENNNNP